VSVTVPYAGDAGLIQPTGLARPQPGRMVFAELFRHSPRWRASPRIAGGWWSWKKESATARAGGLRRAQPKAYGLCGIIPP